MEAARADGPRLDARREEALAELKETLERRAELEAAEKEQLEALLQARREQQVVFMMGALPLVVYRVFENLHRFLPPISLLLSFTFQRC